MFVRNAGVRGCFIVDSAATNAVLVSVTWNQITKRAVLCRAYLRSSSEHYD